MIKTISLSEVLAARPIPKEELEAAIEKQYERIRAYQLREIRSTQKVTQVELSSAVNVSQSQISQLERGDLSTTQIGTLQKYIEALGGHLRLVADFGTITYPLALRDQ